MNTSYSGVSHVKKVADPSPDKQERVNAYFQSQSSYWKDVYTLGGVQAEIIRDRHTAVLNWIESLALPAGSKVLEIGCGAGFMAVALAQRGFQVYAVDSAEAMVEQARRNAIESGTAERLYVEVRDVYSMAFEDGSFDLVIAIGVIPWLERAELAIVEMARVTRPGGYVILTTANQAGLASLLDPLVSPVLSPLKLRIKDLLVRAKIHQQSPSMKFHSSRIIDNTLTRLDFVKTKGMTRGFGFSLFRHSILPEPLSTRLHDQLQCLADRGIPGFRSSGMAYFVLGRKSGFQSRPPTQSRSAGDPAADEANASSPGTSIVDEIHRSLPDEQY